MKKVYLVIVVDDSLTRSDWLSSGFLNSLDLRNYTLIIAVAASLPSHDVENASFLVLTT